ncbi:MAG TPA: hypothetical protein VEQ10_18770, partial [Vicinamibacteria bacterium]|nr:hypothetical protein [Vicinamibacteria bacterium]
MSPRSGQRRRAEDRAGSTPAPAAAAGPQSSPWLRRAPLLAAALAVLVWAPSIAGGFLYDDLTLITLNPAIHDLHALRTVLTYEPSRPLLNLTWALNYAFGGDSPWHYHLVNVLIHAANAALVASLLLWAGRRLDWPDAPRRALAGACLFAASPMAAEAVAYVASRSSLLVAFLALASLRLAVGLLEGGRRWRLMAALGLFLLALATKEEAAALPFLLLLLDYFFVAGQRTSSLRSRLWIHGCFLAIVPAGLLARRLVTGSWLPPQAISPIVYLLTQWTAFPLYLVRAVVPLDPSFYRYHPPAPWPPDASTLGWALLTLIVVVLALHFRTRAPEWSFAVAWLAMGLLPSSSFVSLNEMVADHRAYLGSVGVALAVGGLLLRLGGLRLVGVVLAVFAVRAVAYERVLADPVRAWADAVRRAPGS